MNRFWKAAATVALGLALSGAAQAQSALNEILDSGCSRSEQRETGTR